MLIVDSSPCRAAALAADLRDRGDAVLVVHDATDALRSHARADMVLLDLDLPDRGGLEVCRAIRSRSDVPLIAVTTRVDEVDRVLGLQAGADDCLVRPYGLRELTARMDAVLRRARRPTDGEPAAEPAAGPSAGRIRRGLLSIDVPARQVSLDGRTVEVTRKEFDLLHLLAANPGVVLSRSRLLREIWDGSYSRRTIDTHVNALRNKLGCSSWIETVRGVGYRIGRR